MADRKQVTFQVTAGFTKNGEKTKRWLDVDGEWILEQEKAVSFTVRTSSTPVESIRIEERIHAYFGGIQAFLDISKGLDNARAIILKELEKQVWPEGRPDAEGKALAEQMDTLEKAWIDHTSNTMDGWITMQSMVDRITFLAEWDVLAVEPPDGWKSLASREGFDNQECLAVQNACVEARRAIVRGKGQPSES